MYYLKLAGFVDLAGLIDINEIRNELVVDGYNNYPLHDSEDFSKSYRFCFAKDCYLSDENDKPVVTYKCKCLIHKNEEFFIRPLIYFPSAILEKLEFHKDDPAVVAVIEDVF